jgi:ferritin
MASEKMIEALNKQLNAELYSSYAYVAMAAYFDSQSLEGFAHWMKQQAQEELAHAQRFYAYIDDIGGRVTLAGIDAPKNEYGSPLEVFESVLEHEKKVSKMIYDLVDLARKESDHATETFLQWFVSEQVEEEANASRIVDQMRLVAEHPHGIFMMDRQLGERAAPAAAPAQ